MVNGVEKKWCGYCREYGDHDYASCKAKEKVLDVFSNQLTDRECVGQLMLVGKPSLTLKDIVILLEWFDSTNGDQLKVLMKACQLMDEQSGLTIRNMLIEAELMLAEIEDEEEKAKEELAEAEAKQITGDNGELVWRVD